METIIKQEKLTILDKAVCSVMGLLQCLGIKHHSRRLLNQGQRLFDWVVGRHDEGVCYETVKINFKDQKVITFM